VIASTVFAVDFAPTLLKFTAPATIQYNFDGSALNIPVSVKGTPASALFLVFTKDLAATMPTIRNGYLGWHTVNKTDTCIFHSSAKLLGIGSNTLTWDGKNQDGKAVPKGEYTYYIWGYDSVSAKVFAIPMIAPNYNRNLAFVTRDYQGKQYARPLVYSNNEGAAGVGAEAQATQDKEGWQMRRKWILGSDPLDETLFETCAWTCFGVATPYQPSPYEDSHFFDLSTDNNLLGHIRKWKWIPNGNGEKSPTGVMTANLSTPLTAAQAGGC